jgi:hypothetical protein
MRWFGSRRKDDIQARIVSAALGPFYPRSQASRKATQNRSTVADFAVATRDSEILALRLGEDGMNRYGCRRRTSEKYQAENSEAQHGEAEIDVDVSEQPALRDEIRLEDLHRTQRGVAACSSIAHDQAGVLRERGLKSGIERVGYIHQPHGMQRLATVERDGRSPNSESVASFQTKK